MRSTLTSSTDPVGAYLDAIGSHPILTADEERALGQRIAAGLDAEAELAVDADTLSGRRRRQLQATVEDGLAAQREFAEKNLKLVVSVARKAHKRGEDLGELISLGNFGLLTAVRKFDYRKGFKFSTYATFWIRQAIDRGRQNTGRMIRLPGEAFLLDVQIAKAQVELTATSARTPSDEELAEYLGKPLDKVRVVTATRSVMSLDAPINDETTGSYAELLEAEEIETPDELLAGILDDLPEEQRRLLDLRFGLSSGRPLSMADTGRAMGIPSRQVGAAIEEALTAARRVALVSAAVAA